MVLGKIKRTTDLTLYQNSSPFMATVDNCDTVSNGFIRFQIQSETVQQNETIALEVKTAQDHFRDLTKMI